MFYFYPSNKTGIRILTFASVVTEATYEKHHIHNINAAAKCFSYIKFGCRRHLLPCVILTCKLEIICKLEKTKYVQHF